MIQSFSFQVISSYYFRSTEPRSRHHADDKFKDIIWKRAETKTSHCFAPSGASSAPVKEYIGKLCPISINVAN